MNPVEGNPPTNANYNWAWSTEALLLSYQCIARQRHYQKKQGLGQNSYFYDQ
jgi:hypothetical protein